MTTEREHTERDAMQMRAHRDQWKEHADELLAERDSLLTRVGEADAELTRLAGENVRWVGIVNDLESEREELREALANDHRACVEGVAPDLAPLCHNQAVHDLIARSVLSSRETTDPKPTSSDGADTKSNPDSLVETTDSPEVTP